MGSTQRKYLASKRTSRRPESKSEGDAQTPHGIPKDEGLALPAKTWQRGLGSLPCRPVIANTSRNEELNIYASGRSTAHEIARRFKVHVRCRNACETRGLKNVPSSPPTFPIAVPPARKRQACLTVERAGWTRSGGSRSSRCGGGDWGRVPKDMPNATLSTFPGHM